MNDGGQGTLRIGTSNVVVPVAKEFFPGSFRDKSRLNYYSSIFNTVEINSTFKKTPRLSTFEKWANDVSEDFEFTVKIPKDITHIKDLSAGFATVESFVSAANNLGNKKGCLLIQFPGIITSEFERGVEKILAHIKKAATKSKWRTAVEFRSSTWYRYKTQKFLTRYNTALVQHDMPKSGNLKPCETASFLYLRFHGPTGNYTGYYSDEFLEEQAVRISSYLHKNKDVYAYFNNTMGDAFENAITLGAKVKKLIS